VAQYNAWSAKQFPFCNRNLRTLHDIYVSMGAQLNNIAMDSSKRALVAASGMICTAAAAAIFKAKPPNLQPANSFDIGLAVPKQFGVWSYEPSAGLVLVDPQTKQLLDQIYSQMLTRVYKSDAGYRVMLSIAYGSDQRGALQAHLPEVCYPAQGFVMLGGQDSQIQTPQGSLAVRNLKMVLGARKEAITYWFTIGEQAVITPMDRRIATLKSKLTGRIPDGLLFRVSSIDADATAAFGKQADFVRQLLSSVSGPSRTRLSGLV
jgi:EpsI family protein